MKKIILLTLVIVGISGLFADKYAGEIYQMGMGVQNIALGNTGLTNSESSSLGYWNASLLNETSGLQMELMHSEEFAGLMNYDTFSIIWGEDKQRYSFLISRIGIDDIPLTQKINPSDSLYSDNLEVYDSVDNSDYMCYFAFNRKVRNNLNIGFLPKVAYRTLADEHGYSLGLDLSTNITLSENLLLALKVRDILTSQTFWSTGTHEIIYPGVDLETSYKFIMPIFESDTIFRLRIEENNENIREGSLVNIGMMSFDLHAGLMMKLHRYVDLLAGFDREFFTGGASINIKNYKLNYAFENNTELDNSHRISLSVNL